MRICSDIDHSNLMFYFETIVLTENIIGTFNTIQQDTKKYYSVIKQKLSSANQNPWSGQISIQKQELLVSLLKTVFQNYRIKYDQAEEDSDVVIINTAIS